MNAQWIYTGNGEVRNSKEDALWEADAYHGHKCRRVEQSDGSVRIHAVAGPDKGKLVGVVRVIQEATTAETLSPHRPEGPGEGDLRVWHIGLDSGPIFYHDVKTVAEAVSALNLITKYNLHLSSQGEWGTDETEYAQGLEIYQDGAWSEWEDMLGNSIEDIRSENGECPRCGKPTGLDGRVATLCEHCGANLSCP